MYKQQNEEFYLNVRTFLCCKKKKYLQTSTVSNYENYYYSSIKLMIKFVSNQQIFLQAHKQEKISTLKIFALFH